MKQVVDSLLVSQGIDDSQSVASIMSEDDEIRTRKDIRNVWLKCAQNSTTHNLSIVLFFMITLVWASSTSKGIERIWLCPMLWRYLHIF